MLDAERSLELLDRVGEGILALDASGYVTYLNRTAEQFVSSFFGLSSDLLLQQKIWTALPELAGTRLELEARRFTVERGEVEFEESFRPLDRWFAVRIAATDTGVLCCLRDVTERKRAEEQMHQAQKMEAVGRLAGGIAHDFNNMMMIILGFSDFLLAALDHEDPRRADAEEIRKAADRAQQLARQLLSFGRQQIVARQVLSLNDVITGLERMLGPLLGENIRLQIRLAAEPGAIEADHGQLEQVIMNLALNARDAMHAGGELTIETLDITLPEGYGYEQVGIDIPAGPYVVLRISDTGHGMTPEVRARLFEPFFTTKPTDRNTGLGLATVYGIVVQSAGYIWVDSEVGRGTVFTIYLPYAIGDDIPARETDLPEPMVRGSETVLLVEDEEVVRCLARRVLVDLGYTVLEAADGRDALELVANSELVLDLVLTDVVMPELGGPELVAELRRYYPNVRVVYMSGYSETDKLLPTLVDFAGFLLQKPFSPEDLAFKIREVLDQETPLLR